MKIFLLLIAGLAACASLSLANPSNFWANSERDEELWWAEKYRQHFQLPMMKDIATKDAGNLRLPRNILPREYTIQLIPILDVGNFTTHGYIEIIVECITATTNITMNAAELIIDQDSIIVTDLTENIIVRRGNFIDEQISREMITISWFGPGQFQQGRKYKITMKFISILNDLLRGFYRSKYEEDGQTKYLAVSQMEAPDARRAFPCFDEPNMKATFTVSLGRKTSMSSISNMPKTGSNSNSNIDLPSGYIMDHYEKSVKMSTYLVAFMVSEFISVPSDTSLNRVEFNVWTRSSFRNQTKYAGNIGPRILKFFEYFFQIDYPLPKQDMAAIPDFAAGAMENWGLITYRESDLLFDEKRSSEVAKQRVAEVVAHELAHQWFGNLVTIDWWNVIWLNEGFARYMQYIGTDAVEPSFQMNDQFGVVTLQSIFQIDGLESSRPINLEVSTADEINAMFDSISYNKGACIIRMCANFVGLEAFQYGVTNYLNKKAYDNAIQDDLWQALQEQADSDGIELPTTVKKIMESWTEKMGFPLINVTRDYDRGNAAQITQKRFLLRQSATSTDPTIYRWWVPLTYTLSFNQPHSSVWISENQDSVSVFNIASRDQWVIFNVNQVGYYRVHYDNTNYYLILQQLLKDHRVIPAVNRAQLLDDSLNIARAGLMQYGIAMELTKYLELEREYVPWTAASNALDYIDLMFYEQIDVNLWKEYMSSLVDKLYAYVGFDQRPGDSHLTIYTRSHAVNWACVRLDNSDCIRDASFVYSRWMSNPTSDNNNNISPNLLRLITCTAIRNGGWAEWNFGYEKYLNSTLVNEKNDLLRAITCSKEPDIINNMLELMIDSNSGIRLQDVNTFFSNIASNEVGNEIALDFLINRWDDVVNYLNGYAGFGGGSMPSLFRALCNRINTDNKLEKLMKLYNDHPNELGMSKTAQQGVEVAQANLDWVTKNYADIVIWLNNHKMPDTTVPTTSQPQTTSSATTNQYFLIVIMVNLWVRAILY